MNRVIPNLAHFSLNRLEESVIHDLDRITQQLARLEAMETLDDARIATAQTYREMITKRMQLLDEIRDQSRKFDAEAAEVEHAIV